VNAPERIDDWLPDFVRWPPAEATRHRAVLGQGADGRATLRADRDADWPLLEAAEARLGQPLGWQRCSPEALQVWLDAAQAQGRALDGVDGDAAPAEGVAVAQELTLARLAGEGSPAVRLLDAVLYDALRDGASDVHLERRPGGALVRLRLDGVMWPLKQVEGSALAEQMVSRLKVMAELDIGERRLPQDGRFRLRVLGREVDFRLSVMPGVHGEDAVVRVLDHAGAGRGEDRLTLAGLGFDAATCDALRTLARRPHGLLLVTGPTGSGKTTTLYAAIAEVHQGREKIITIEDPVEYELPGVVQIPVNERKGLSFARGLRSILRHDPDRVLVGEIRDPETAQIAVQAALTGHLVFSSVHANQAFDVIGRFVHMGLDPYNLVSALEAVLAQRLMRRLCTVCAQPAEPDPARRALLDGLGTPPWSLRRAVGCAQCHGTGYSGRRPVAELLRLDDGLRDLIVERAPLLRLKAAARERGLLPLRSAALALVAQGVTSFEEFDRVVGDEV
jgi:general secretion pathway protein E